MEDFILNPTNSLIGGAFNILKSDADDDPFTSVLKPSAINMEESYFVSAISHINKMNKHYTDSKIKLFAAIAEATSTAVVLESFSDYFVQVEAITDKSLRFIRTKLDQFFDIMETMINEETPIIKEHRKELENITYYKDDNVNGYDYTITENIPDYSALDTFNASLFDSLYKPTITDLNADRVKETVSELDLEQDYKKFRGSILGAQDSIGENEFASELYKIYRNRTTDTSKYELSAKSIRDIVDKWFGFAEIKKQLNAQYQNISKSYEAILKKISAVCKDNNGLSIHAFSNLMPADLKLNKIDGKNADTEGVMMSGDMMVQLDIYCKAKVDQMEKYTDITTMAFTAKLDAIKEQYMQYRRILLSAIEVMDHPNEYYDTTKKPIEDADKKKIDESAVLSEDAKATITKAAGDFVEKVKAIIDKIKKLFDAAITKICPSIISDTKLIKNNKTLIDKYISNCKNTTCNYKAYNIPFAEIINAVDKFEDELLDHYWHSDDDWTESSEGKNGLNDIKAASNRTLEEGSQNFSSSDSMIKFMENLKQCILGYKKSIKNISISKKYAKEELKINKPDMALLNEAYKMLQKAAEDDIKACVGALKAGRATIIKIIAECKHLDKIKTEALIEASNKEYDEALASIIESASLEV